MTPAVGGAGGEACSHTDVDGHADDEEGTKPVVDGITGPGLKQMKFPRVDPRSVEDQPGQAVREDTPGYIAQAFPRLVTTRHR